MMRLPSLTDQILIKAKRIRNIQTSKTNIIGDSELDEFTGIINYCLMVMMIDGKKLTENSEVNIDELSLWHDQYAQECYELMKRKNTDYGEVWRDMRVPSMTDLILTKLKRIKQIEDNEGQTKVSEGIVSNYQDILNYAVFCIILLDETSLKS